MTDRGVLVGLSAGALGAERRPGPRASPPLSGRRGRTAVIGLQFLGGRAHPVSASGLLPGRVNWLVGRRSAWRTNIPTYEAVTYHGVFPGIDAVFHGRGGRLEYDFRVGAGARLQSIALGVTGARSLRLGRDGELVLSTAAGELIQPRPLIYQQAAPARRLVDGGWRLVHGRLGFWARGYDSRRPLVIDPTLAYSTYLGGSNGPAYGNGIAVDGSGDAYVVGTAYSGDFPTTAGAFQTTNHAVSGANAFVTKLNSTGTALVYSTYLGGTTRATGTGPAVDSGNGIAVDGRGDAYVVGTTASDDFPTTPGAYQTTNHTGGGGTNTVNAFVTKLNPAGTGLVYSTYLGGSGTEHEGDSANAVAVDGHGNAYVTGVTASRDFPTTAGAYQTANNSTLDVPGNAFVTKVNADGTTLGYSTYLGESGTGIAVDAGGQAYVVGHSAFVTELAPTGGAVVFSSYLGGSGNGGPDSASGIVLDCSGGAYVTGTTGSSDFPTTPAAYQTTKHTAGSAAFAAKLIVGTAPSSSCPSGGGNQPPPLGGGPQPPPKAKRHALRALVVHVTPHRAQGPPYRYLISGRIVLPRGVSKRAGCRGHLREHIQRGHLTIAVRRTNVTRNCTHRLRVTLPSRRGLGHNGRLGIIVRFLGNAALKPKTGRPAMVFYG
jgi:hypothetical protein